MPLSLAENNMWAQWPGKASPVLCCSARAGTANRENHQEAHPWGAPYPEDYFWSSHPEVPAVCLWPGRWFLWLVIAANKLISKGNNSYLGKGRLTALTQPLELDRKTISHGSQYLVNELSLPKLLIYFWWPVNNMAPESPAADCSARACHMLKGGAGGMQRALCTEFAWSAAQTRALVVQCHSVAQNPLFKGCRVHTYMCVYVFVCIYNVFCIPFDFFFLQVPLPPARQRRQKHSTHICTWGLLFCSANTFLLLLVKSLWYF